MLPPKNQEQDLDMIDHMEGYYKTAFLGFDEDDIFYEGEFDNLVPRPEGQPATIPTTGRAVVDEAVDNATPEDYRIHYAPRGVTQKAEKAADSVRRFVRSMLLYWRTAGTDIDDTRDFIKNLAKSGKACYKLVPDWTLWPTLAEDVEKELRAEGLEKLLERVEMIKKIRQQNFALVRRSIAPQCIMEDPTIGGRKLWVIERYEDTLWEVANTYSKDIEELRQYADTHFDTVPVHEIWTLPYVDHNGRLVPGRHSVYVNRGPVLDEDNPYPFIPYVIKYSGFGREAYEGKPELKAVGFFTRQNKSMLLAEARRFTHFDSIVSQLAWPTGFLPEDADTAALDLAPGAVNFVPTEVMEHIPNMWAVPPIPESSYLTSLNSISAQIERGTVQRTLRGAGVPGTDSAAQYNLINQQSKLRIASLRQAAEAADTETAVMALMYIDSVFEDDMSVFAAEEKVSKYTIGPSTIQGHHRVVVEYKVDEDAEKERKLVLATDAVAKDALSEYDALVFAGFDNASEIIQRKYAYKMLNQPVVMEAIAKKQLREWGIDADEVELVARVHDAEQQRLLSDIMNYMQAGTLRGVGDPNSPTGSPADAITPGSMAGGGGRTPPGNVSALPLPQGAPPAIQGAGTNGAIQNIQAVAG